MSKPGEVLVGSVFSGHENNAFWLALQLEHLKTSLRTFDHVVYLNNASEQLFTESLVVGRTDSPRTNSLGHLDGLKEIVAYCKANPHNYYLILDSDCFPVRDDWMEMLVQSMNKCNKRFAAPVRTENLDTFAHPSAVFTWDVGCLDFAFQPKHNLLNRETNDVMCAGSPNDWFPLIRTNRMIRHPVIASIYYDAFYHHGCGSRAFNIRSVNLGYYDYIIERFADPAELMNELKQDPKAFISSIR